MNDGQWDWITNKFVSENFETIANWIEKNIETTD